MAFPETPTSASRSTHGTSRRSEQTPLDPAAPGRFRPVSMVLPVLVVLVISGVVISTARSPVERARGDRGVAVAAIDPAVARLNSKFQSTWRSTQVTPAAQAEDLQILRRLSLALHGTVPSLEEVRSFEADTGEDKLNRWVGRMLADPRFHQYFAERLARALVGTDNGQFIIFRRDRFVSWLSEQLRDDKPWDETVRTLVAQEGLWTDRPAVNFISHAADDGKLDENKLAGRVARVFLGQRIDCAQCHDHPFAEWKQGQFEGLASFFGQAKVTITGIEDRTVVDNKPVQYVIQDRHTLKDRVVEPQAPVNPQWLPATGSRRQRLAAWITHPENRRFERAIANRVWGLLFGKPLVEPVDDLPDPKPDTVDALDILGQDFREQHYSLRRLVQVIAASQPFRASSEASQSLSAEAIEQAECQWAQFPLIRLRPEQVIGSILQASSVQTADQNSHLLLRVIRLTRERDFVRDYGDLADSELEERGGTIPQRLLLMNGNLAGEMLESNPLNSIARISMMASTDERCIECLYLVCLTRRPSPQELDHFKKLLAGQTGRDRERRIEDIVWGLCNSTEFTWNH